MPNSIPNSLRAKPLSLFWTLFWTSIWAIIFAIELVMCLAVAGAIRSVLVIGTTPAVEVRVATPSTHPQLAFACELDTPELQSLFADPNVMRDLRRLDAGVSVSLIDLSPGRAAVVRRLNDAQIPVTAWMSLPKEQGYYLNSSNATQAALRFRDFQKWTTANGLRWSGIGLDIEPNLQEFTAARQGSVLRAVGSILRRLFDPGIVRRARSDYAALISQMRSAGYRVDTYQFPFIADERAVHSTLLERLFGIVDVHGDREALMLYSSFNHRADSAVIWRYGPSAQVIVVGSTAGDPEPGSKFIPLSFEELAHDLIVARHFSPVAGIYNLEASVLRGFLPRLIDLDWNQSILISANSNLQVIRLRARIQSALWTLDRLPYFAIAILLADVWFVVRRRKR